MNEFIFNELATADATGLINCRSNKKSKTEAVRLNDTRSTEGNRFSIASESLFLLKIAFGFQSRLISPKVITVQKQNTMSFIHYGPRRDNRISANQNNPEFDKTKCILQFRKRAR
jgi:hypothetical protein